MVMMQTASGGAMEAEIRIIVATFTGLAALQVGGRTIQSFFGFDLGLQKRSHLLLTGTP